MPAAQAGYLELLKKNSSFRLLWLGQVISLFGDWFDFIASAALVARLTGSGLAVGSLFVVRMLAPFLVSPAAGVVADRYNRKALLVISDLSRVVIVLGYLLVRRPEQAWLLFALTAIQLGIGGFYFPARNAILPDLVSPEELGAANALVSITWSVMLAFGAAIGGLASGAWGIYPAYVIDSATFLFSALLVLRIPYAVKMAAPGSQSMVPNPLKEYLEGIRYLRNHVDILFLTLHKAAIALAISGGFQVLQVVLSERVFVMGSGGSTSLGLLFGMAGIGTGLGPVISRWFTGDEARKLRIAIFISYLLSTLGMLMGAPLTSFIWLLLGTLVRGIGGGMNWAFSSQLLLELTPAKMRGRVFSTEFAFFTLANAIGAAVVGWVLDQRFLSFSAMMVWMAALAAILGIFWGGWISRPKATEAG